MSNLPSTTKEVASRRKLWGNLARKRLPVQAIAFSGMMLTLTLLFSYLAHFSILPFASFLNVDISLIFILATLIISGFKLAFINMVLKLVIAPAFTGRYDTIGFIGHTILFITFVTLVTTYMLLIAAHNLKAKKSHPYLEISFQYQLLYLALAFFLTTILISTLNTFIFNGIYFYLFGSLNDPSYNTLVATYQESNLKVLFFGFDNYVAGSYALYLSFNAVQFTISYLLLVPFVVFICKNKKHFIFKKHW